MKQFKFNKKEYVVMEKDLLEDSLYVAITLCNNLIMKNIRPENTTEADVFTMKHLVSARDIVDKIIIKLEES